MVCIDQETGLKSAQPLKTLGKLRGSRVSVKIAKYGAYMYFFLPTLYGDLYFGQNGLEGLFYTFKVLLILTL